MINTDNEFDNTVPYERLVDTRMPLLAARALADGKAARGHHRVQLVVAMAMVLCAQPCTVAAQSQTQVPLFQPWRCTDISQRLNAISGSLGYQHVCSQAILNLHAPCSTQTAPLFHRRCNPVPHTPPYTLHPCRVHALHPSPVPHMCTLIL